MPNLRQKCLVASALERLFQPNIRVPRLRQRSVHARKSQHSLGVSVGLRSFEPSPNAVQPTKAHSKTGKTRIAHKGGASGQQKPGARPWVAAGKHPVTALLCKKDILTYISIYINYISVICMYMYTCMSKDVCLYHLIPRKSDAQKKMWSQSLPNPMQTTSESFVITQAVYCLATSWRRQIQH